MLVKGKNFNLYVQNDGQWRLIYCSRSCTLSIDTEVIPTTRKGDGAYNRFVAKRITWTASADGLVSFDSSFNSISLTSLQLSRSTIRLRAEMDDESDNVVVYEGDAIIESTEHTGVYNEMATFSASFQGSGPLVVSNDATDSEAEVFAFQYEATGGEESISLPELIDADLIDCSRTFDLFIRIYPDAYGSDEVQFRSNTGTIVFGTMLSEGEKVTGIYKK